MFSKRIVLLLTAIVLLITISLHAESVFIKNGQIYEGKIVKENDSAVVIVLKDRTEIKIPRSNIIRITLSSNYKKLQYLKKMDGDAIEIYLVDEDAESYTYRTELESPDEYRILKDDVDGITKKPTAADDWDVQPENADSEKSGEAGGYSISAGGGIPYGIAGLQYSYYFKIIPEFSIAPYAATGVVYPFIKSGFVPFSFGTMFAYGTRHRLFADFTFCFYQDSQSEDRRIFSGAAGYEFCPDGGFIVRIAAGPCYELHDGKGRLFPVLPSAGVGFKF